MTAKTNLYNYFFRKVLWKNHKNIFIFHKNEPPKNKNLNWHMFDVGSESETDDASESSSVDWESDISDNVCISK